jgi:hypothetical protein
MNNPYRYITISLIALFIGFGYFFYRLMAEIEELKTALIHSNNIQKGILIAVANKPDTPDNHFWLIVPILGFITLFWNPIYHKVFEKLIDYIVNKLTSLEWKFETISFRWYLLLFWTNFPDKNIMVLEDILASSYHRLLFEMYKNTRSFNIFSGKSGSIGYKLQFKPEVSVNATRYLQKTYDTTKNLLGGDHDKIDKIFYFFQKFMYSEIGVMPIFLIQSSFLACTKILDREQTKEFVESAFEYFVRSDAQTDADINDIHIQKLTQAYTFITNETQAKFIEETWKEFQVDKKGTFLSLLVQSIP